MPHHIRYRGVAGSPGLGVGLGVALTAWFLGSRHAFDADHISCIDNTTRKLMSDGKRPLGTGFFFALGHSTVIVVVGIGLSIAARAVFGAVVDPASGYENIAGGLPPTLCPRPLPLIPALHSCSPAPPGGPRRGGGGPRLWPLRCCPPGGCPCSTPWTGSS